ncbi:hypothetical protein TRFO_36259 [Tritrichomonas foetus]|uniref:Viral A-type inclusion protein n=1 Tax=Tritrichomonas foetus TaxID=1144522 RepID=A0A1J4JGZ0_9EUKA|nr:hypothetical protein TRFO_36259 [Tritrichomonas foetus]|eukprot:OHS97535.1 hypothetical protein TRFO_36259 [Tritrichomonas foetus]
MSNFPQSYNRQRFRPRKDNLNLSSENSNSSENDFGANQITDSLHIHTLQLSNLLQTMKLYNINSTLKPTNDPEEIMRLINLILNDLNELGNSPKVSIGNRSHSYEALNIISFALLILYKSSTSKNQKNENESVSNLQTKIQILENKLTELKNIKPANPSNRFNPFQDVEKNIDDVFNFLITEFDLPKGMSQNDVLSTIHQIRLNQTQNSKNFAFSGQPFNDVSSGFTEINGGKNFVLESELQALQIKCKCLEEENQKRRQKINSLRLENSELLNQIHSKNNIIDDLKMKNDKLALEKDEFSQAANNTPQNIKNQKEKENQKIKSNEQIKTNEKIINNENEKMNKSMNGCINECETSSEVEVLKRQIELKERENGKLSKVVLDLSKQIEDCNKQLEKENSNKNRIFYLMQQQTSALIEYESYYQKYQNQINDSEKALKAAQSRTEELEKKLGSKTKCDHSEITSTLKYYFSSKINQNDITNIVLDILNEENEPAITKVVEILEILIKKIQQQKIEQKNQIEMMKNSQNDKIIQYNERLMQYCTSMIQFFEHLANSGEMQGWMIDLPCHEDLRPLLLSQCNKIEAFMTQNKEFKEFSEDFLSFPSRIESFINENNIYKEIDWNELFLILQLCSTANDALRRCADRMNDANHHLTCDIKTLRYELKQSNHDAEIRLQETSSKLQKQINEHKKARDSAEKLLQQIVSELQLSRNSGETLKKCLLLINGDQSDNYTNSPSQSTSEILSETSSDNSLKKNSKSKRLTKIDSDENSSECSEIESKNIKIKKTNSADTSKFDTYQKEKLEAQINALTDEKNFLINQNQNLEQKIMLFDSLQISKNALEIEVRNLKKEIEKSNKIIHDLQSSLDATQTEANNLKKVVNDQNSRLTVLDDLESSQIIKDQEIESLNNEIEIWKTKHNKLDSSINEDKMNLRKGYKDKINRLKGDLRTQLQKNEDLRNHFEPLMNDLRQKLQDSRTNESNQIKLAQEFEESNQRLNSEINTLRIENRMLKMKHDATEEKLLRDKNLIETQCRMKLLNLEMQYQGEIEQKQAEFQCHNHEFYIQICQRFKEFVNFNNEITENSVFEVLDKVVHEITNVTETNHKLEENVSELATVKALIGCENDEKIVDLLTKLISKCHKYNQLKNQHKKLIHKIKEENEQQAKNLHSTFTDATLYEWEQWAKKLSALISDNFLSLRTAKELMFSIEEALVGSINQRMTIKRLEMLRLEKSILVSGILDKINSNYTNSNHTNNNSNIRISNCFSKCQNDVRKQQISLNTLILVLTSIRKLQKISGHLPCVILPPIKKLHIDSKSE